MPPFKPELGRNICLADSEMQLKYNLQSYSGAFNKCHGILENTLFGFQQAVSNKNHDYETAVEFYFIRPYLIVKEAMPVFW